ncbi:MAG: hypothetical protein Q9214_007299 [Letrouitia sp. 1 TL-2023]
MIERAKSVIFIIDEFHLFASHPRQTLLYNLFDVAQSRNAPIAVLGLTSKLDVVESLEKRVKSRFGQRYIYLSYARNFKAFEAICRSALVVSPHKTGLTPFRLAKVADNRDIHTSWNRYVDSLFASDDDLQYLLRRIYAVTKSVPSFLSSALVPISRLSPTNLPTGSSFVSNALLPPDSNLHLLSALSDLELSLVIAAARLDIILDTDVCNFNMVYEEYLQLASKVRMQSNAAGQAVAGGRARVWSREMAKASWERLVELELILPVGAGGRGLEDGAMWRVDVALEEIGPSVPGLGSAMCAAMEICTIRKTETREAMTYRSRSGNAFEICNVTLPSLSHTLSLSAWNVDIVEQLPPMLCAAVCPSSHGRYWQHAAEAVVELGGERWKHSVLLNRIELPYWEIRRQTGGCAGGVSLFCMTR